MRQISLRNIALIFASLIAIIVVISTGRLGGFNGGHGVRTIRGSTNDATRLQPSPPHVIPLTLPLVHKKIDTTVQYDPSAHSCDSLVCRRSIPKHEEVTSPLLSCKSTQCKVDWSSVSSDTPKSEIMKTVLAHDKCFASMIEEAGNPLAVNGARKYFKPKYWHDAELRWKIVQSYHTLDSSDTVLDMSTGFGYFPKYGELTGLVHSVDATDVAMGSTWYNPREVSDLYNPVTCALGIDKYEPYFVMAFTPLPTRKINQNIESHKKYDLITSFMICFDTWSGAWGSVEWIYWLCSVRNTLLKKHGALVLGFTSTTRKNAVFYTLHKVLGIPSSMFSKNRPHDVIKSSTIADSLYISSEILALIPCNKCQPIKPGIRLHPEIREECNKSVKGNEEGNEQELVSRVLDCKRDGNGGGVVSSNFATRDDASALRDFNGKIAASNRWAFIQTYRTLTRTEQVLDLSTGFGYFPLHGKVHELVDSIDATGVKSNLYDTCTCDFGIRKYSNFNIMPFVPLPKLAPAKRYDIVTSFDIDFDIVNGYWGASEWVYFLCSVRRDLLKDGGAIVLGFSSIHGIKTRREVVAFALRFKLGLPSVSNETPDMMYIPWNHLQVIDCSVNNVMLV